MPRNYDVCEKSYWFASDIAEFYGVSMVMANNIKEKVEIEYGSILVDKHKKKRAVSADCVIKSMGGIDREHEIQTKIKLLELEKKNG